MSIYFNIDELTDKIAEKNYFKLFVLVDENTRKHCLPILEKYFTNLEIIEIQSGEIHKNLQTCSQIWQSLLDNKVDRKSVLINLGGGVITDMGGFCAATYKRGIDFIHIPTTLLAMVDASVGGKLGIDFDFVKNAIGLFSNPEAILIHPPFLKTLPQNHIRSGWAEIVKHGLIADKDYVEDLITTDFTAIHSEDWNPIIQKSLSIKQRIVDKDAKENGLRKILNFGHTIGHAIESYSLKNDNNPLLHGEAVAIGMICELYLSHLLIRLNQKDVEKYAEYLIKTFGKYPLKKSIYPEIIALMSNDKKNNHDAILCSLLSTVGKCEYDISLKTTDIEKSLDFYVDF